MQVQTLPGPPELSLQTGLVGHNFGSLKVSCGASISGGWCLLVRLAEITEHKMARVVFDLIAELH